MSIYPISVKDDYDNPESPWYDQRENLKQQLKYSFCCKCRKSLKHCWKKVWAMHSFTWGYGEVWCSKKCLECED